MINPYIAWWYMMGLAMAPFTEMLEPWFQNKEEKK